MHKRTLLALVLAKPYLLHVLIFVLVFNLYGAQVAFRETMPSPTNPKLVSQSVIIGQLKLKVVKLWVFRFVGAKQYDSFGPLIRPDTADRFIANYRVIKPSAENRVWELNGFLDGDGLKRWVRLTSQRIGQGPLTRPAILISGPAYSPEKIPFKTIDSSARKWLKTLGLTDTVASPVESETPAITSEEIGNFAQALRSSSLGSCLSFFFTTDGKLRVYFYSVNPPKLMALGEYVLPASTEGNSAAKIQALLNEKLPLLSPAVEEVIASGILVSTRFRIRIQGIESFLRYKQIDKYFSQVDPITALEFKLAEPQAIEYEVASTLTLAEFTKNLSSYNSGELALKIDKQESSRLILSPQ